LPILLGIIGVVLGLIIPKFIRICSINDIILRDYIANKQPRLIIPWAIAFLRVTYLAWLITRFLSFFFRIEPYPVLRFNLLSPSAGWQVIFIAFYAPHILSGGLHGLLVLSCHNPLPASRASLSAAVNLSTYFTLGG
jgi:hypothetical protein